MGLHIKKDGVDIPLNGIPSSYPASNISYSNITSGLGSTTAQGAIDELTEIIGSTLSAGATTVSFSDARIKTTSAIDPYMWVEGSGEIISPTAISVSNGTCVLTFDAQANDTLVGIRVF